MKTKLYLIFIISIYLASNVSNNIVTSKFKIATSRVPIQSEARKPVEFIDPKFDVKNFLYKMGYAQDKKEVETRLTGKFSKITDLLKDIAFKQMIKLFQKYYNLKETGELDSETVNKMKQPRCGLPDLRSTSISGSGGKFSKFKLAETKWTKNDLTWKLMNHTNDLGPGIIRDLTKRAFQIWSDQTPLSFTEVCKTCKADLVIDFARGHHDNESERDAFDGFGGVLAHAAPPDDGRIHFDDDEHFTAAGNSGTSYLIVAAHEIGHALGLEHSRASKALMFPYYTYVENLTLSMDDILGIQSIYGKPKNIPKTTPTITTTKANTNTNVTSFKVITTTTTKKTPTITATKPNSLGYIPPCMQEYDAIFTDSNNIYTIIDGEDLWAYSLNRKIWERKNLYENYPALEEHARGGVTCKHNHTWFFKRYRIWAYHGSKLLPGFPKKASDPLYPVHPTTAVYKNGILYLVKAHLAYRLNTRTFVIEDIVHMSELFPKLERTIDAAIRFNGQIYFFKGKCVYKFDDKKDETQEAKTKYEAWFPCSSHKDQFASCNIKPTNKPNPTNTAYNYNHSRNPYHNPYGK